MVGPMFILGSRELIIGLGSNASNALSMLRLARKRLRAHPSLRLVASSAIYESDALIPIRAPCEWDRPYLNAACRMKMVDDLSAEAVVAILKTIERSLGRADALRWAPRAIDLDLLDWGKAAVTNATGTVPHVGLTSRPFALLPALDCAELSEISAVHRAWRYSHPEQVPFRTRVSAHTWTELVGILNLTPDSFSDGGKNVGHTQIQKTVAEMAAAGTTVIDLGAESTRPGATPLSSAQEIQRLEPALGTLLALRDKLGVKLSLDTRHAATVAWALERGLPDWLNDVEGFVDAEMLKMAMRTDCKLIVMHSLGVPPRGDLTLEPSGDPMAALLQWGAAKIRILSEIGIAPDRIIIDPGVGFGKTVAQNFAILERADELGKLQANLLVGHSRKRFLDPENKNPAAERDLETAILTARMAKSGVDYLRAHAPAIQARALKIGAMFH